MTVPSDPKEAAHQLLALFRLSSIARFVNPAREFAAAFKSSVRAEYARE